MMLDSVFSYFIQGIDDERERKIHRTQVAPIYFQHLGTVIRLSGGAELTKRIRTFNDHCWCGD